MQSRNLTPILLASALGACSSSGRSAEPSVDLETALDEISTERILADIETLSSDAFEGRAPGTAGDQRTVEFLVRSFREAGLAPGNPDGTYVQAVPLMGFETSAQATLHTKAGERALRPREDYVAVARRERVDLADLELVFVGYGTVAPEYDWDDYEGVDVRGKAIVMLVNDPPLPSARDPLKLDDTVFRGKAMTYYGRWTYKYEIAREMGAAAAILVHETGPAGYPWEVVSGSWGREGFDLAGPDAADAHVPIEAWIQRGVAEALFADSGRDFDALKKAALSRAFKPIPLPGASISFDCRTNTRTIESRNVLGLLPGHDPRKRDELIVLTAHWDHLGKDPSRSGDQVFNGAVDNASGTAGLIEMARILSQVRLDRSVLFLAVTAEEKGLLGSKYYATHPLYPLARTLLNVNIDSMNTYGRTRDVVSIGKGFSTLDAVLERQAAVQGRRVEPDPEPEKGFYFRSDHFSFVKQGVPALYAESGIDYAGRPAGWGKARRDRYTAEQYHKPADEIGDDWDLAGMVDDLALYMRVVTDVSQSKAWPEWNPGSEFRAVREAMLAADRR
jgi:Zn-dependent M28 family amino/carboxypeptidase